MKTLPDFFGRRRRPSLNEPPIFTSRGARRLSFRGSTGSSLGDGRLHIWPARGRALWLAGLFTLVWLFGEMWCRHLGWKATGARALLSSLAAGCSKYTFRHILALVFLALMWASVWWLLGKWARWRRPAVPLVGLLTFQILYLLRSHPAGARGPHHISPTEWTVAIGLGGALLSALVAWSAQPQRNLRDRAALPRAAVTFLRRRHWPWQAFGMACMALAVLLTWWAAAPGFGYHSPLFSSGHPWNWGRIMLVFLTSDGIFWGGRTLWRRTWRRQ